MARIYTKTGDAGQTALVGGQRVSKADGRIEAYGTVDELNSWLGLVRNGLENSNATSKVLPEFQPEFVQLSAALEELQHRLFDLGSLLAATAPDRQQYQLAAIRETSVQNLEKIIDALQAKCPALRQFILPAGPEVSCHLQIARTVARRAERNLLSISFPQDEVPALSVAFLNRISDFLFVAARFMTFALGQTETPWRK